ncbi:hypothetical protein [Vagococcus silagei]|nr:hypothetical protein [Vagococcus silagei]
MRKENTILLGVFLILALLYVINPTIFKIVLVISMIGFGIFLSIKLRKD